MTITTYRIKRTLLAAAISAAALTACGGGSSSSQTTPTQAETPTKKLGKNALKKAGSTSAFLAYYQLGLNNGYGNLSVKTHLTDATAENASVTADGSGGITGNTTNKFGVSSTNLIEQGVDEADFVKQNTTHIFTTSQQLSTAATPSSSGLNRVDVIHAYAKPNTNEIGSYQLENIDGLNGIFLSNKRLIALVNKSSPQWYAENTAARKNGEIEIRVLDVSNPSAMKASRTFAWEGSLRTSRRIGDSLYVVSSSSISNPWNCPIRPAITTNKVAKVAAMPICKPKPLTEAQIVERMPVDILGKKLKPDDCLIPAYYKKDSKHVNSNITLVTKVDLTDNEKHESTCIAASAEHVYMNTKSIYLSGYGEDNNTAINKFNINQSTSAGKTASPSESSIHYAGSGRVDGHINWNTSGSFSLNEYNDVLRVVTTQWKNGKITNLLHTLKESNEKVELENMVTLPNKANPKPIGKPNERIEGVRFLGDEAYVVTFRRTDPLYKIDLTDPAKPKIKGELEMPGYSAYLHRINDKHLLGVGYSANNMGRVTGIQTTVFDTSTDNPRIVSQETLKNENGWVNLPIAQDSRAITTLKNDKAMRVALPFTNSGYTDGKYRHHQRAAEYEVDIATGKLTPTATRELVKAQNYYGSKRRAMMDGDDIYYNDNKGGISQYIWAK